MEMLEPAAPAGTTAPPNGVATTVRVAAARDCTETEVGDVASVTPAACCTCNVTSWIATRPSPEAETAMVAKPTAAADEAVNDNVEVAFAALGAGVIGLVLHAAVTPGGRPLTERPMLPLNDPPVVAVKATDPWVP
jgi:hypothetical protein